MKVSIATFVAVAIFAQSSYENTAAVFASANEDGGWANIVSVGPRPYYLIDQMKPSSVKDALGMSSKILLASCLIKNFNFDLLPLLIILSHRPWKNTNTHSLLLFIHLVFDNHQ